MIFPHSQNDPAFKPDNCCQQLCIYGLVMQEKEDNGTLRNCFKIEFPDPEEYVVCADVYRHTHATW